MKHVFNLWADELRSCAERISVLSQFPFIFFNRNLLFIHCRECTAFEQVPDQFGGFDLHEMSSMLFGSTRKELTWPGWGLVMLWINGWNDPRVPTRASVPIAVQI